MRQWWPTKGLVLGTYASISKTSHTNGVFVIAGVSGIILDVIPYQGSATFTELKVPKTTSLPDPANSVVYFDNYFSGLPLFNYLKHNMNIRSLGTLRPNRIGGCPIETDKILTKQGKRQF
nr:unnamed protein product [Callosobruchus chinensis]